MMTRWMKVKKSLDKFPRSVHRIVRQVVHSVVTETTLMKNIYCRTHKEDLAEEEKSPSPGRKKTNYPADFEAAYQFYPRKEGKLKAYGIYRRQIKIKQDQSDLIHAINNYRIKKRKSDPQFLVYFSTFMGH